MSLSAAALLLPVLLCVIAGRLVHGATARAAVILAAGALMVVALAPVPAAALPVPVMALTGCAALRVMARRPGAAALWGGILALVLVFLAARHAAPALGLLPPIGLAGSIGLSYVMFRLLHLLVDAHWGEAPREVTPLVLLAWLLFPPSFVAGPMHRFQDFAEDLAAGSPPRGAAAWAALRQVLAGLFLGIVPAGVAFLAFGAAEARLLSGAAWPVGWGALAVFAFAAWLYWGFAGYSEAARGTAALIGVRLPANFDAPWKAENFLAIWSRWHLSLSEFFKLYLFNPLLRLLLERSARPKLAPWLGAAAYLATFALMGVWHGAGWRFLLYGLVLGVAAGANRIWQAEAARRLGRQRYAALTRAPHYVAASRALGLGTFLLALSFLWVPDALLVAPPAIWLGTAGAVPLLAWLGALGAPRLADALSAGRVALPPALLPWLQAALLAAWLIVAGVQGVPPLIYAGF